MEENNMDMEYKRIYVVVICVRYDIKMFEIFEKVIYYLLLFYVVLVF